MKKIVLTLSLFTFLVAASTSSYAFNNSTTVIENVKGEKDKEKAKKKKATAEKKTSTEKSEKGKKSCTHTCTGKKTS